MGLIFSPSFPARSLKSLQGPSVGERAVGGKAPGRGERREETERGGGGFVTGGARNEGGFPPPCFSRRPLCQLAREQRKQRRAELVGGHAARGLTHCPHPPAPGGAPAAASRPTRPETQRGRHGEGALRPCPAALPADFPCFDTCARCPVLLSLIYCPIKGSVFLEPPALHPSAPSSLQHCGGVPECATRAVR